MTKIEELHEAYCEDTRLLVKCTMFRLLAWEAWQKQGFTLDDLHVVCRGLRRAVDNSKRTIGCMSFHLLICDLEYFEERLAEYRSYQRKPKFAPGKADVLKATKRPDEPAPQPAAPIKDVIKGLKMAEQLREFKKRL